MVKIRNYRTAFGSHFRDADRRKRMRVFSYRYGKRFFGKRFLRRYNLPD